jgi:hypothetical protein
MSGAYLKLLSLRIGSANVLLLFIVTIDRTISTEIIAKFTSMNLTLFSRNSFKLTHI